MNAGLIKGSMTTIRNNVSHIAYEDLLAMRDMIKAEIAERKPKASVSNGTGKRGRPSMYATAQERKDAIERKRKEKLQERNAALIAAGKPIPKRGRPRKQLDLCDIMCN